jgi:hypothetical protein
MLTPTATMAALPSPGHADHVPTSTQLRAARAAMGWSLAELPHLYWRSADRGGELGFAAAVPYGSDTNFAAVSFIGPLCLKG